MSANHYKKLIDKLFSINLHGGMKLGLSNVIRLNELLGSPAFCYPAVHVGGTNGKGSVTTKIAKGLEAEGKKVGLYTSPHISCFRERIQINGMMISEEEVCKLLENIFQISEKAGLQPTFFEITTLMAFHYFALQKIDIAVLEVGLGGRLDATNIIRPLASVITSISLEHCDLLGNSLEEIAQEKAGIIKAGIPVVIGPRVPANIIKAKADMMGSPFIQVKGSFDDFDAENCAVAQKALELLNVSPQSIEKGLLEKPLCRMQTFLPGVILDVAHNPDGLMHLFNAIDRLYHGRSKRIIFGISKDKNISECLKILKNYGALFYFVQGDNGRGALPSELKTSLVSMGIAEDLISTTDSIGKALESALKDATQKDLVIVCGTFFIMREARQALGIQEPCDAMDLNERRQALK